MVKFKNLKMDLGVSIIGAILIAICVVPFIIMSQNRKKRERKTLQLLTNISNQHNCILSQHEICGDFIIGIDETKYFVFFFKQFKGKVVEQSINLAEIQSCKVKTSVRNVSIKSDSYNVIEKIELNFIMIDKSKKDTSMVFYNADNSLAFVGELQSVEKWAKIINDSLKSKNQKPINQSPVLPHKDLILSPS